MSFEPNANSSDHDPILEFYQNHCIYLPAMLGWFLFSAALSSYNKYVFGSGHMAFPCPLLLTSIHFGLQWLFSHFACELFPAALGTERVKQMSWKEWRDISIPCGLVTALDVGLSNLSLVTITITFYTMVKSSTPIFVLGWAYIFGIERITWRLIGVAAVIAGGEFLTVMGEGDGDNDGDGKPDFSWHGFILCLCASILSGARWTLVQLKLQRMEPPLKTTIVTMRLLSPCMFWSMVLISAIIERPWYALSHMENTEDLMQVLVLGTIGGSFAISMILCEFYLILKASAMVLMIGGVIKELTTITIGVTFFGDKLNVINVTGFFFVFLGVILYKIVFHIEKEERKQTRAEEQEILYEEAPTDNKGNHAGDESTALFDRTLEMVDSVIETSPLKNDDGQGKLV